MGRGTIMRPVLGQEVSLGRPPVVFLFGGGGGGRGGGGCGSGGCGGVGVVWGGCVSGCVSVGG